MILPPHVSAPSAPAKAPFNTLAPIALALTFLTLIGGIVCGHVALSQIARTGERGRWLAVSALVIGYGAIAVVAAVPVTALVLHLLHR